jgi:hypothetical protein
MESDMSTFVARSRRLKKMPSLEEFEKKLLFGRRRTLRENGRERQVSVIEAVYRVEIAKALEGDQRAIEFLFKRGEAIAAAEAAKEAERNPHAERAEVLLQAIEEIFLPVRAARGGEEPTSQLRPPSAGGGGRSDRPQLTDLSGRKNLRTVGLSILNFDRHETSRRRAA